ncbi:DoxX family protein [Halorussus salilacus]|uniref:DoxX family protein n=1 Tax=Halorussus salilacus TaxID=2953750 RepID=UPI0034A4035D
MSILGGVSIERPAATDPRPETESGGDTDSGAVPPKTHSTTFRFARALFGGVLAFTAFDNLRDIEGNVEYAESKGAPAAGTTVPLVSGGLLFGGLGIATWKLPRLAAVAAAGFLVSVTPLMHDFWNVEDEDEKEQQLVHFLKNAALLGGTLAFLRVAHDDRKTN